MTDDEALRLGARVAGLREYEDRPTVWEIAYPWSLGFHHPAFAAYVAELLVRKAYDAGGLITEALERLMFPTLDYWTPDDAFVAWEESTPIYRIRAALVALGHEEAGEGS